MKIDFISKQDLEEFKKELIDIVKSYRSEEGPKKWLRSKEVRKMLGISPGTLQNMRIQGNIPFSKIGGTLFYDSGEIDKILNENKIVN